MYKNTTFNRIPTKVYEKAFLTAIALLSDSCLISFVSAIWQLWTLFTHVFFLVEHTIPIPASVVCCQCRLLITIANSLDPGQARQNVGPDLDPDCLTLWWCSWKNYLKIFILKKSADDKIYEKFSSMQCAIPCLRFSTDWHLTSLPVIYNMPTLDK